MTFSLPKHVVVVNKACLKLFFSCSAYAEDLRDIKPPIDLPADYFLWFVLLGILALGGIAFLVRFLILRLKQPKKILEPTKLSWKIALERLNALQQQNLPQQGQVKEYYSQLSDIIRRYMEDRFHIRAPEMTTQEFLWSLNNFRGLTDLHKNLLKNFLNSCDLVKFAKYGPTLNEMDESFQFAVKLVEETKGERSMGEGESIHL